MDKSWKQICKVCGNPDSNLTQLTDGLMGFCDLPKILKHFTDVSLQLSVVNSDVFPECS